MAKKTGTVKKRVVKVGTEGKVFVHSTFNNVIITIANADGQVISWSSAGKMGFRGSKKNTPYAAQTAATDCAKVAYDLGLRKVKVYVKGPGAGRESAIRTVHGAGIEVTEIVDVTGAVRRRPHWRGFGEWGSPFGRLPARLQPGRGDRRIGRIPNLAGGMSASLQNGGPPFVKTDLKQ